MSAVSTMPASWEVVCRWVPHPVLSITSGFSNTATLQRGITTTAIGRRSCRTYENCMHVEQIIIIFYIFLFIFCSMYLVLFSIVLYRTIVTVYTDNIFLYNYKWQMHQIIHLSPVGCFTPAWGKTVQKNWEVSGFKLIFISYPTALQILSLSRINYALLVFNIISILFVSVFIYFKSI